MAKVARENEKDTHTADHGSLDASTSAASLLGRQFTYCWVLFWLDCVAMEKVDNACNIVQLLYYYKSILSCTSIAIVV